MCFGLANESAQWLELSLGKIGLGELDFPSLDEATAAQPGELIARDAVGASR